MSRSAVGFGTLLLLIGVVAYVATGMASVTALIPSFFGMVLVALGALGRTERFEKPALYGALGVSILGLLGSVSGITQTISYMGGGEVARPSASITRAIMAVVLMALVAVLTRALVARRAR